MKRFSRSVSYQCLQLVQTACSLRHNCCGGGDNTRIPDPENLRYDRGLATFDRTHILSMNAIYKLPLLTGKPRCPELFGWLGGNGIYQYATGVPLTITGGPSIESTTARPGPERKALTPPRTGSTRARMSCQRSWDASDSHQKVQSGRPDTTWTSHFTATSNCRGGMSISSGRVLQCVEPYSVPGYRYGFSTGSGTNHSGQQIEGVSLIPNSNT